MRSAPPCRTRAPAAVLRAPSGAAEWPCRHLVACHDLTRIKHRATPRRHVQRRTTCPGRLRSATIVSGARRYEAAPIRLYDPGLKGSFPGHCDTFSTDLPRRPKRLGDEYARALAGGVGSIGAAVAARAASARPSLGVRA